jgi:hypothetical protein
MYRGKEEKDIYLGHKSATSYRSNNAPFFLYRFSLLAAWGRDEEGDIPVVYYAVRSLLPYQNRRGKHKAIKIAETYI